MILVTGATGHVGRAVVSWLASLGHDVVAMIRDVHAASRRLPSGIALRVADYEDASALKSALAGIDDKDLISSDGDASAVMRHHANAIESATATNIRHRLSYVITGHQALTLDEIVTAFGKVVSQPIQYRDTDIGDYLVWAWARLHDPWPHAFSTLCASIAEGRYSYVSGDFTQLVGKEPESLQEFLRRTLSAKSPDHL
jgi:uncharacterized protein YbjT (DUF2867 family)